MLNSVEKAVQQRSITEPLIHHSDRGTQYCSNEFARLLGSAPTPPGFTAFFRQNAGGWFCAATGVPASMPCGR